DNQPTEGTTTSEPPKTSDSCSNKETDPALTLQYPKTAEPAYDDV
ncbi:TPA: DNA-binding protein, partial [Klebsiella pneumoniae subsp. pneumoniae]|nr:DNA-binding protein [Klebsiella pneumoniae subsp. pneumoniae]